MWPAPLSQLIAPTLALAPLLSGELPGGGACLLPGAGDGHVAHAVEEDHGGCYRVEGHRRGGVGAVVLHGPPAESSSGRRGDGWVEVSETDARPDGQ